MGKSVLPEEFEISSEMRGWAELKAPQVNIDVEHETFCDYWRGHGKKMAYWPAVWRNWMRRAPKMGGATYSADEVRIRVLMKDYTAKGFRRAYVHETSTMYSAAFEASSLAQLPQRDMRGVLQLVAGKRA